MLHDGRPLNYCFGCGDMVRVLMVQAPEITQEFRLEATAIIRSHLLAIAAALERRAERPVCRALTSIYPSGFGV